MLEINYERTYKMIDSIIRSMKFRPRRNRSKIKYLNEAKLAIKKQIPSSPVLLVDVNNQGSYTNLCTCGHNIDNCKNYCDNCGQRIKRGPSKKFMELFEEF